MKRRYELSVASVIGALRALHVSTFRTPYQGLAETSTPDMLRVMLVSFDSARRAAFNGLALISNDPSKRRVVFGAT